MVNSIKALSGKVRQYAPTIVLSLALLLPAVTISSFTIPFAYLMLPVCGLYILYWTKSNFSVLFRSSRIMALVSFLWILIVLEILLSTFISTRMRLGYFLFPRETIQYVARAIFFTFMFIMSYTGLVETRQIIRSFIFVFILAMLIGILQWIPWPGRIVFIKLYPFRDGQFQIDRLDSPLLWARMHGFAQHATANAGFAVFIAAYSVAVLIADKASRRASLLLLFFSTVNILASVSRAGLMSALFSTILFLLIGLYLTDNRRRIIRIAVISGSIFVAVLIILFLSGNNYVTFIFNRFLRLFSSSGGGRFTVQAKYFFSLLHGSDYLFGLSNPVINLSEITYGIESEPLNIFVNYGLLGVLLQYSLVVVLLRYYFAKLTLPRLRSNDREAFLLTLASFVGLFSYQVFSTGYFFFRDITIGFIPWLIFGTAVGHLERIDAMPSGKCLNCSLPESELSD